MHLLVPASEKHILYAECTKENYSAEQIFILEREGVFPYDYVDGIQRLNETSLPSQEDFYNGLNDEKISDDDYAFAQNVWREFHMRTLGDYTSLYMKTDVLLLAVVFENFRNTCMRIYRLDPAHYFTSPGLSWDAMPKFTGVRIELMTNIDIEDGIRGGITQCSKRYVKANNIKYDNNMSDHEILLEMNTINGEIEKKKSKLYELSNKHVKHGIIVKTIV